MALLGIDVGGTFTDFVANLHGRLHLWKVPTTNPPSFGVLQGLCHLREEKFSRIVHGTTIATNALLEEKWAKTALLTTQGFRDVLEIGRQNRPKLYDLFCERPALIVPREWRLEVPERLDAEGKVIQPLDEKAVRILAEKLRGKVDSVAVVLLFSFLNPDHEQRVRAILEEEGVNVPITLSSEVLPEFREFERTSTTVITAALRPLVEKYLADLAEALGEKFLVMQSNGGVAGPLEASRKAAGLLLSGPAGGVGGAKFVAEKAGFTNLITFDMGGTSTDVSLVRNGEISYTAEKEIAGRPVRLPMVDVHTVGAGGGSIAWVDSGGMLRVGPRSAGADPGPACYGRGGQEPTVTDAHLLLGHLSTQRPLAGVLPLYLDPGEKALEGLAEKLGLDLFSLAEGVLEVVEATMEQAIRVITVERGHDPRDFVLVAFGGAGPLHAVSLARKLEIPKVFVPAQAGVLSALGLITADIVHTYVRSLVAPLGRTPLPKANAILAEMRKEAEKILTEEGVSPEDWEFHYALDLRYRGQGFELTIPLSSGSLQAEALPPLIQEFHRKHAEIYGFSNLNAEVELVSLRLTAIGRTEKPDLPEIPSKGSLSAAVLEERLVFFVGEGWRKTPVYSREKLPGSAELIGPAVVEGLESTVLVPPRARAFLDRFGNIILEV
jgi:N-methylhydantoinase A